MSDAWTDGLDCIPQILALWTKKLPVPWQRHIASNHGDRVWLDIWGSGNFLIVIKIL